MVSGDPSVTQDEYLSQESIEKFQDLLDRLQRSKIEQARKGAIESGAATLL